MFSPVTMITIIHSNNLTKKWHFQTTWVGKLNFGMEPYFDDEIWRENWVALTKKNPECLGS